MCSRAPIVHLLTLTALSLNYLPLPNSSASALESRGVLKSLTISCAIIRGVRRQLNDKYGSSYSIPRGASEY